jgi:hypothetical protein
MSNRTWWLTGLAGLVVLAIAVPQAQRGAPSATEKLTPLATPVTKADARVMKLKEQVSADVLGMSTLGQQMVDSVFSFGELPEIGNARCCGLDDRFALPAAAADRSSGAPYLSEKSGQRSSSLRFLSPAILRSYG